MTWITSNRNRSLVLGFFIQLALIQSIDQLFNQSVSLDHSNSNDQTIFKHPVDLSLNLAIASLICLSFSFFRFIKQSINQSSYNLVSCYEVIVRTDSAIDQSLDQSTKQLLSRSISCDEQSLSEGYSEDEPSLINRSNNQSNGQFVLEPINENTDSESEPFGRPSINHRIKQSINQSANQPSNLVVSITLAFLFAAYFHTLTKSISYVIEQSNGQSTNQTNNQTINLSIALIFMIEAGCLPIIALMLHLIHRSVNHFNNQSNNQSVNEYGYEQQADQSVNQSVSMSTLVSLMVAPFGLIVYSLGSINQSNTQSNSQLIGYCFLFVSITAITRVAHSFSQSINPLSKQSNLNQAAFFMSFLLINWLIGVINESIYLSINQLSQYESWLSISVLCAYLLYSVNQSVNHSSAEASNDETGDRSTSQILAPSPISTQMTQATNQLDYFFMNPLIGASLLMGYHLLNQSTNQTMDQTVNLIGCLMVFAASVNQIFHCSRCLDDDDLSSNQSNNQSINHTSNPPSKQSNTRFNQSMFLTFIVCLVCFAPSIVLLLPAHPSDQPLSHPNSQASSPSLVSVNDQSFNQSNNQPFIHFIAPVRLNEPLIIHGARFDLINQSMSLSHNQPVDQTADQSAKPLVDQVINILVGPINCVARQIEANFVACDLEWPSRRISPISDRSISSYLDQINNQTTPKSTEQSNGQPESRLDDELIKQSIIQTNNLPELAEYEVKMTYRLVNSSLVHSLGQSANSGDQSAVHASTSPVNQSFYQPIRHVQSHWQKQHVLLILHFNSAGAFIDRSNALIAKYQMLFNSIITVAPPHEGYREFNQSIDQSDSQSITRLPDIICAGATKGWRAYTCTAEVLKRYGPIGQSINQSNNQSLKPFTGFLYVHFDCLPNFYALEKNDLSMIWQMGHWGGANVNEKTTWSHWDEVPKLHLAMKELWNMSNHANNQSDSQSNNQSNNLNSTDLSVDISHVQPISSLYDSYVDNYIRNIGSYDYVKYGGADLYYLPASYSSSFYEISKIGSVFDKHNVFIELGYEWITAAIAKNTTNEVHRMNGFYEWRLVHQEDKLFWQNDNWEFFHPMPLQNEIGWKMINERVRQGLPIVNGAKEFRTEQSMSDRLK